MCPPDSLAKQTPTLDGKFTLSDKRLGGSLVRVSTVSELHPLNADGARLVAVKRSVLLSEVIRNRLVVRRSRLERLEGQSSLSLLPDLAVLLPLGNDGLIVRRRGDDGDSGVVLGSRSEEGNTSDVNLLDRSSERALGVGDRQDEGVEVADDKGDGRDLVGGKVGQVGLDLSGKDTYRENA